MCKKNKNKNKKVRGIPSIVVPYPCELTIDEILSRRTEKNLASSRAPNCFFLYKMAYMKELRKIVNENVPMTTMSSFISSAWSKEPSKLKEHYISLSQQLEIRLKEINEIKEIRQTETIVHITVNFPQQPPRPQPPKPSCESQHLPFQQLNEYLPVESTFFYPDTSPQSV